MGSLNERLVSKWKKQTSHGEHMRCQSRKTGMAKVFESAPQLLACPRVLHVELANPHCLSGAAVRQVDGVGGRAELAESKRPSP